MHHLDPTTLHLDQGGHNGPTAGHCLMEAVSMFAREPFTDEPRCVSPVLRIFGMRLNDVLDDDKRQTLRPYIPRLVGTAGDGLDEARSYMALDWLIRVYTPTWLRLVPALTGQADLLAQQGPIRSLEDAAAVGDAVREAASQASAAGAAAWAAAGAAAGDAAGAAARDALSPTVAALQDSAIDLYGVMITAVSTT